MIALRVLDFLRSGGTYADLLAKYAIKHRRHTEHPNLVLLKYDQIASPFAEEIVRECRGIVVDEADDWRPVSFAFTKFFNHGEGHAAAIDWSTARVQEKLDGSLCVLYAYAGRWHVATTGTPDASGDVNGMGIVFRDLFWQTFDARDNELPPLDCGACFFFELTTPLNRVVVRHAEASVTLLGARDLRTHCELTARDAASLYMPGVATVEEHALQSFDDIAATFASLNPLDHEGYVVVDGHFNRVKVKHPGYVALHHAKGGLSRRAFVDIARSGETSEVIAAFPEFAPMLNETKGRFEALVAEVEADYAKHSAIEVQKDYAIAVRGLRCTAALFHVRAKKSPDVRAFFREARTDMVLDLLGYRTDEGLPANAEEAAQ